MVTMKKRIRCDVLLAPLAPRLIHSGLALYELAPLAALAMSLACT